jgi:hypothetical protein
MKNRGAQTEIIGRMAGMKGGAAVGSRVAGLGLGVLIGGGPLSVAWGDEGPRLVVLVVVDQLGAEQIERAGKYLKGGFGRLLGADGYQAVALHRHAGTETCPGHATLATGASPRGHGYPGNEFYDGEKVVYCLDAGPPPMERLGDVVRGGGGEVVALSLKDRGASLIAGENPTLAAWMSRPEGVLVQRVKGGEGQWDGKSGNPAADGGLVPVELVAESLVDSWLAKDWVATAPGGLPWVRVADDREVEKDLGNGRSFPHTAESGKGMSRATRLLTSPAGGWLLTEAALASIERYRLGADEKADLLSVSYSHYDGIGHTWTGGSWESAEALVALDADLGRMMERLDGLVGEGKWAMVLTGDHGGSLEAPQYVDLPAAVAAALPPEEGPFAAVVNIQDSSVYVDPRADPQLRELTLRRLREKLVEWPGIESVVDPKLPAGPYAEAFMLNWVPGRSPDLTAVLEPHFQRLYSGGPSGGNHGAPRKYDQAVPYLAWGAGIRAGRGGVVDTRQIAPTVARLVGLKPPNGAELGTISLSLEE